MPTSAQQHSSQFSIKQRVTVDGFKDLVATVTAVLFRDTRTPSYEVSWVHNGTATAAWIEEWRLTTAEGNQ